MTPGDTSPDSLPLKLDKLQHRSFITHKQSDVDPMPSKLISIDSLDDLKYDSSVSPRRSVSTADNTPANGKSNTSRTVTDLLSSAARDLYPVVNGDLDKSNCENTNDGTAVSNEDAPRSTESTANSHGSLSTLTNVSALQNVPRKTRGTSKQLLLDGGATSMPLEPCKKRASKADGYKREHVSATSLLGFKPPCNNVVPFWLTAPKNVKEIGPYVKTICSRLSNIEKHIKSFEAERQTLLNALYRLNNQQVQAMFSPSSSVSHHDSANMPNGTCDDVSHDLSVTENKTAEGDLSNITSCGNDHENLVANEAAAGDVENDNSNTVDTQQDESLQGPAYHNITQLDVMIPKEDEQTAGLTNTLNDTQNTVDAESRHELLSTTLSDTVDVIVIDDDAGLGPKDNNDFSEELMADFCHHSSHLEDDMEFISVRDVESRVPDYNVDPPSDSVNQGNIAMWRSCWLQKDDQVSRDTRYYAHRRPSLSNYINRKDRQFEAVDSAVTNAATAYKADEDTSSDPLDYFWNVDFSLLPQSSLQKWAKFFGLKTSITTRAMVDSMEKIRNYLSTFCPK
ncbi:hypothetical protein BaOVIS_022680 [Babesia ovis]|uniref:Uncharacterized protein n=1 Tax=Babesia ovis TaxID=5869 RepID=A0A9W5TEM6_BABOV|nr:hypothetical protein BaOVIS_022680 [Babesia ovis]